MRYFEEDYAPGWSYFAGDAGRVVGEWSGGAAGRLGLAGRPVTRGNFHSLAEGVAPDGTPLVRHPGGEGRLAHRAGWDVLTGAPKSVSAAAIGGRDGRLLRLFHHAAEVAYSELERFARARAGADRSERHETGNLACATFTHYANRNEEVHLHQHRIAFNLTWDAGARDGEGRATGGFRALEPSGLYAGQGRATAVFRAALAKGMRGLGYELTVDDKGAPQIAGMTPGLLAALSTRSLEAERVVAAARERARARGLVWTEKMEAEAQERAAKQTRKGKRPGLDPEGVGESCRRTCLAHGVDLVALVEGAKRRAQDRTPEECRKEEVQTLRAVEGALDLATEHFGERQGVFSADELEGHCLGQTRHIGKYDLEDVRAALARRVASGALLKGRGSEGQVLYTTPELLRGEEGALARVKSARAENAPLAGPGEVEAVLTGGTTADMLNADQGRAFSYLASAGEGVLGLHGKAGAGKSFVFGRLLNLARGRGYRARAFAPTLEAVETLRREGLPAETVQSHLARGARGEAGEPELWLLDEAGLLGSLQMHAFLDKAAREKARVVLAGDTRQFASVTAGRAFGQLLEGGLPFVGLERSLRQEGAPAAVRRAVEEASRGEARAALEALTRGRRVFSSEDPAERSAFVARLYAALPGETLVVCATNAERRGLNAAVRGALVRKGEVGEKGWVSEVYLNKNVTRAGRKEAVHYERGNRVRFARVRHGVLRVGVWYEVVGRDLLRNRVTLKGPEGVRVTYDPAAHYGVEDVFTAERREFAAGDRVQFRGTDAGAGVRSGLAGRVVSVDGSGRMVVRTAGGLTKEVDLTRYRTLDHAYAVTGHGAQSRTADNAVVVQTSRHRKEVVNRASLYVGLSRTRGELFLVTDDPAEAAGALDREHRKVAALDLGLGQGLAPGVAPEGALPGSPPDRGF